MRKILVKIITYFSGLVMVMEELFMGGEKMKKHSIIFSVVCILLMSTTFSSAFAKDLNLPDGQKIDYFSQGEGYIAVPVGALYANSPATSSRLLVMMVRGAHLVQPTT